MTKMKAVLAFLIFSTQCQSTTAHLRHNAGSKISNAEKVIQSVEKLSEEHFFHIISDGETSPSSSKTRSLSTTRRLQHPCVSQGETVNGVEFDCVVGSSGQRILQFSVFQDSRTIETLYSDASNPEDSAIGNVIVYDGADLHSVDMESIQGRVQGTCTVVSTVPSAYCSFFYEIIMDGRPDMYFTAEGRVDNSKIEGSTLTISGGYNGLEDSSGIVILTPASLDWGSDPPRPVPDNNIFDGYLAKFQVQLNYDLFSSLEEIGTNGGPE